MIDSWSACGKFWRYYNQEWALMCWYIRQPNLLNCAKNAHLCATRLLPRVK